MKVIRKLEKYTKILKNQINLYEIRLMENHWIFKLINNEIIKKNLEINKNILKIGLFWKFNKFMEEFSKMWLKITKKI